MLSFLGSPVLIVAAAIQARRSGSRQATRWIIAALVLCGVALLVTGAANIPLNDDLAQAGYPASGASLAAAREDFEDPWVVWNIVRTVASTAALACLVYAQIVLRPRAA